MEAQTNQSLTNSKQGKDKKYTQRKVIFLLCSPFKLRPFTTSNFLEGNCRVVTPQLNVAQPTHL